MRGDGILTFTAEYPEAMGIEIRESLSKHLQPREDLLFLDFAYIKDRIFKKPAFLVLTSQRFLLFRWELFQLEKLAAVPWPLVQSVEALPERKFRLFGPVTKAVRLKYSLSDGQKAALQFSIGRPGTPDKSETFSRNLSLHFSVDGREIFTVADTIIIYYQGEFQHTRMRRWIFDLVPYMQGQGVLVLLTNEAVAQQRLHNLVFLDYSGEVRWRADLPSSEGIADSYLRFKVEDGRVFGYTWSGFVCELDIITGDIINMHRISKGGLSGPNLVDLVFPSACGQYQADLFYVGEDRFGVKLYRLFIEPGVLVKERFFGGVAQWSPNGRYLAVQEIFFTRSQGFQSVGLVLFDLEEKREALVEKSIEPSFIPLGWESDKLLQYGNQQTISVDKVFWLPLQQKWRKSNEKSDSNN